MSGVHHHHVQANRDLFKRHFKKCSCDYAKLAKRCSVGQSVARKLVLGNKIRRTTMERVARRQAFKKYLFEELIEVDVKNQIPSDIKSICSFKYGFFSDHHRSTGGSPIWLRERIELKVSKRNPIFKQDLVFTGRIRGNQSSKLDSCRIHAERVSPWLFTLTAKSTDNTYGFQASFMWYLPEQEILCGLWIGLSHCMTPAVYRMFLSKKRLGGSRDQWTAALDALSIKVPIRLLLKPADFKIS